MRVGKEREDIMAENKTNVMRLLDQKKIAWQAHSYPHEGGAPDGMSVAAMIGRDPSCVLKTLVARGASKTCYVFVIPVNAELDLKKAARAAGEKSVAMVHVNELLALTGYVRGGCSPLGMKKRYATFLDASAAQKERVVVSAGKIGSQVELSPADLTALSGASAADLITEG